MQHVAILCNTGQGELLPPKQNRAKKRQCKLFTCVAVSCDEGDEGVAAARYTLEQARMVLTATNAAKKSAARAHTPYKWVCELISLSLSKLLSNLCLIPIASALNHFSLI